MLEEDDDHESYQNLPIFKKGIEILELTEKVISLIPDDEEMLSHYKEWMMEDASILSVKVAGAEGADLYDIKMENATLIRKAARDLMVHCTGLRISGFKQTDYLEVIRNEIEEYRLLFIDWIATFDPWNYVIDRWGLFNPPGIDADTPDPDDDL